MDEVKFEIKKYKTLDNTIWDDFIRTSKNGFFMFERSYLDYHQDRFIDHSLCIYKKNKLVAVFPANQIDHIIYSHGGLTFGSLIISKQIRTNEVIEIFKNISDYYKNLGFISIIYKAIPYIFHPYPSQEDLYALFLLDAKLIRRDISSVIDLGEPYKFSESKKQAVTKCEKLDIQIKENNNFTNFWDLLVQVLQKFDTKPVHSLAEINTLKSSFPDNIILYEAYRGDELLAGIVVYDFGNVIHTQYMANSNEGRKIGALDFINHTLIEKYKNEKQYYSFGISTENQGRVLNEGLIQQKEMMGGRAVALDFYQINLKN